MRYFRASGYIQKILLSLIVVVWTAGCAGTKETPAKAIGNKYPRVKASTFSKTKATSESRVVSSTRKIIDPELYDVSKNRVFKVKNGAFEYVVGPGDVLSITFWRGAKSETTDITVRPDGKISYSFLDDLRVSGRTAAEVDSLITEELREFVKRPRIDVLVKEHNSKKVALFGEIASLPGKALSGPNIYPLKGKTTLLDLLLLAGGQTEEADMSRVELIRRGKLYRLNLVSALLGGEVYRGVVLDDGDRVLVPKLKETAEKKVLVLGEVNRPGIYAFKEGPTLTEIIAEAKGTTRAAVLDDVYIIRGDLKAPNLIKVNFKRILREGDLRQNYVLNNKDIVYVPKSKLYKFKDWVDTVGPVLDFFLKPADFRNAYTSGATFLKF